MFSRTFQLNQEDSGYYRWKQIDSENKYKTRIALIAWKTPEIAYQELLRTIDHNNWFEWVIESQM